MNLAGINQHLHTSLITYDTTVVIHYPEDRPSVTESKPAHPDTFGAGTIFVLLTLPTVCFIFLLWRRASALRGVVSHQCVSSHRHVSAPILTRARAPSSAPVAKRLQTWTRGKDGPIRLSTDDGPPAAEFLEDDDEYDEDNTGLTVEQALAASRSELSLNPSAHSSSHHLLLAHDGDEQAVVGGAHAPPSHIEGEQDGSAVWGR
jgi:hypothetical protein